MKFRLCLLFCLITIATCAQSNIDVLHYKYSIELNDNNDTIYGLAEIKLKMLSVTNVVKFDLTLQNATGKGMKVDKVTGPGVRGFQKNTDSIQIMLSPGKGPAENDTATYIIRYHGIPADGLIIAKNKYGNRTFFADNWPNRAHHWLPCVDEPADKASVEFIVTAPSRYQVVSNGIQVEESNLPDNKKLTHWKEDVPVSTKVMVIGVADFAVSLSGIVDGCVPVYSWVYPEDRDKGFYDYALAADILPFFSKYVAPYAYRKLANVESKTRYGGLENANTIFYSEFSIDGKRTSETLLAHEIAHQWFGNMATEKTFAHLWLSEGFATYMTVLYMENKYGSDTAIAMLKEDRDQVAGYSKRSPNAVVNNTTDYMSLLNPNSYQKGGWVLHMLRSQFGDSVFQHCIRTYYAYYGGKTADTDDLRRIFETITGKDLKQFFTQWLYTPGIPRLNISWKYMTDEKKLAVTVEQLQETAFTFPLELLMIDNMKKEDAQKIQVSQKKETFYLPVTSPVSKLITDPFTTLLYEGTVTQAK